jgi:hypothetical protein
MRFMSILGLCLMAVFALVQSIPLAEKDRTGPEQEKLNQAIAVQQQRTQLLEAELERLRAQIQSAQERNSNVQRALSSTQQQLTLLAEQTQQARSDRDRVTAELDVLRRQLAQGRDELAGIQQAARDKAVSLSELQRQLSGERKKIDDISQRANALNRKRAATASAPLSEKRPPPVPGSGQQGFTLRFASTAALDRLVAAESVSLYGMADKRAWRLSLSAGSPVFAPDSFPGWFHEMTASTVPVEYLQALAKSVGQLAPSSVVWGVQLPPATTQKIASLTRGLQGGNLVIGADGQVTLEAE